MKKNIKRLLCTVLVLCMVFSLVPMTALADRGHKDDGWGGNGGSAPTITAKKAASALGTLYTRCLTAKNDGAWSNEYLKNFNVDASTLTVGTVVWNEGSGWEPGYWSCEVTLSTAPYAEKYNNVENQQHSTHRLASTQAETVKLTLKYDDWNGWYYDSWDSYCTVIDLEHTLKHTVTFRYVAESGTLPSAIVPNPTSAAVEENAAIVYPTNTGDYAVDGGVWKFQEWDKKNAVMGKSDMTITGTWKFVPSVYTVTFEYESGTDGMALPAGLTPNVSGAEYKTGETIAYPTNTSAFADAGNDGVWTFQGWDKEPAAMGTASLTITGTWTFRANTHKVSYEFISNTAGKTLPAEIPAAPADVDGLKKGDAIPYTTGYEAVAVYGGTWTFQGWYAADGSAAPSTMGNADVRVKGYWTFTEAAKYSVSYVVTGDAPATITGTMPTGGSYIEKATVAVAGDLSTAETTKDGKKGVWTFDGWTSSDVTIKNGEFSMPGKNVTLTGTWSFTEDEKYTLSYEFRAADGELPAGMPAAPASKDYYEDDVIPAAKADYDDVKVTGGVWKFDGWNNEPATMPGENTKVIGYWHFVKDEVKTFSITYKFENYNKLPKAVQDQLPEKVTGLKAGDSRELPYCTGVETSDGFWSFEGWDTDEKVTVITDHDVVLTGSWTFYEKQPEDTGIDITLDLTKKVEGKPGYAEKFNFEVYLLEKVEGRVNKYTKYVLANYDITVAKNKTSASKTFTMNLRDEDFKKIQDGAKLYIREIDDSDKNWTYDDTIYEMEINHNNGELYFKFKDVDAKDTAKNWKSSVTFTNVYGEVSDDGGVVIITKVDSKDKDTTLSGAKFYLYKVGRKDDTKIGGTYKTGKDGKLTVKELEPGDYYFVEVGAPAGYKLDKSPIEFTIKNDDSVVKITVKNTKSSVPGYFTDDHFAYIVGYPDGTVRPSANITRAEVATIFFRLLTDDVRTRYMTSSNSFSDVNKGDWYNTAISTLSSMGIVKGYADGTFDPNGNITRGEFAAIAARFEKNGNTTDADFSDIYTYWGKKEISIAANNGWVLGYEDGSFKPNQLITRAEAMTMVNRVLQRIPQSTKDLLKGMITWSDNRDTDEWYYLAVQEATNSHDYELKTNGYETWTELLPARDWTKLEK